MSSRKRMYNEVYIALRDRLKEEGITYTRLSPATKAVLCNGCGPKGAFVPVPEFIFTASCNHHDYRYFIGGTERDRYHADRDFYVAMRRDANDYPQLAKRSRYRLWAWLYYKAVRIFGRFCFWYDE